jgi:hypothetical protein
MAANNFGSVVKTMIILGIKKALVRNPALRALAVDASNPNLNYGDTVKARRPVELTVGNVTVDADGIPQLSEAGAVTAQTFPVTINKFKEVTFQFNSLELSKDDQLDAFIREQSLYLANGIASAVTQDILALVLAAAFDDAATGNAPVIAATGAGERQTIIDAGVALGEAEQPDEGRWGLVTPTLYGEFVADEVIARSDANAGSDAIQTGRITRAHGFDVDEFSRVPANGEGLRGIFGHKNAFISAFTIPKNAEQLSLAPNATYQMVVTDKASGISVLYYEYSKPKTMQIIRKALIMYGVSVADPAALVAVREEELE